MAVEDITSATQAVATGSFAPVEDSAATYETPNVLRSLLVDRDGSLVSRSTVLTDEGSWRESFSGPLSVDWQQNAGGGSLVQAGSTLTITGSLVPGDQSYVSRLADYAPVVVSVALGTGGLAPAVVRGGGTSESFFGLYALDLAANPLLDPAHPSAQQAFVEWVFPAGLGLQGFLRSRSTPAATEGAALVTVTNTAAAGFRQIVLDVATALFRDGSTVLPAATVRATRSRELPGPYLPLFFSAGCRAGAAPLAPLPSIALDTVLVQSIDRLTVNPAL
jgi:hypothetical protein